MSRTHTFRILMLSISVSTLAACGGGSTGHSTKTSAPMPPIEEMDAAMNDPSAPPTPLTLSESDTLTPVMPAAPAQTTTTVATTAATAADGSMEARMAKLEQSVNALRTDYNRIMPAFASLNTTNERIQTLLDEMETEGRVSAAMNTAPRPLSTPAVTPPAALASPAAAASSVTRAPGTVSVRPDETVTQTTTVQTVTETETITEPQATVPPAPPLTSVATPSTETVSPKATDNTVTGVRIGEHGSKTRVVFDLTSKTKPDFKYDLDNAEKILVVDMPASAWTAAQGGKPNSPMIAGWTAGKGQTGGSNIAIQLKKDARILSTEYLKAEGKDPARLVLDIAPAK